MSFLTLVESVIVEKSVLAKASAEAEKMKQAVGPLIVIAENNGLIDAASNLPGVDIVTVNNLNAELLAPSTHQAD